MNIHQFNQMIAPIAWECVCQSDVVMRMTELSFRTRAFKLKFQHTRTDKLPQKNKRVGVLSCDNCEKGCNAPHNKGS